MSMSAEITKPEAVGAVHGRFKYHRQMGLSINIGVRPPIVGANQQDMFRDNGAFIRKGAKRAWTSLAGSWRIRNDPHFHLCSSV